MNFLKHLSERNKGVFIIHFTIFVLSATAIIGNVLVLHPAVIVFYRVLFASAFMFGYLMLLGYPFKLKDNKAYVHMLVQGFLLACHWICFFQAVQKAGVSSGLLANATYPLFSIVLEPLFFKEPYKASYIFFAFLSATGICLIAPEGFSFSTQLEGIFWGVASGASFSVLSLVNRKTVKDYDPKLITFYQDLFATLCLVPVLFFFTIPKGVENWLLLISLGLVFTAFAHSLFIKGLSKVNVQTASVISAMEPVYGILLAVFLLNEKLSLNVFVGGLLILSSVFMISFFKK